MFIWLLLIIAIIHAFYLQDQDIKFIAYDRSNNTITYEGIGQITNGQISFYTNGYQFINNKLYYKNIFIKSYEFNTQIIPLYGSTYDNLIESCIYNKWIMDDFIICEKDNMIISIIGYNIYIKILETFLKTTQRHQWYLDKKTCLLPWLASNNCNKNLINQTKICIFFHGAGESENLEPLQDQYIDYWGKIHLYTPYCYERWFIRRDTITRGWDNLKLQKDFCELALMGDSIIRNKIIIAHSMGNLVFSAALKNNLCKIDWNTTEYLQIAGPLNGSPAADFIDDICKKAHEGYKPELYRYVANKLGYCNDSRALPVYHTLSPTYPGIQELDYIKNFTKGSMCGVSSYGLNSRYSLALYLLNTIVGYHEYNDGMVPKSSCQSSLNYTHDYQHNNYIGNLNHADLTCRNGDGYWGGEYPCSYFINKN